MGSNTTYDIPVTATGVNAPSASLINDDADGRTFEFVSTVTSDEAKIFASADGVNFPPTLNTTPLLTLGGNSPPKTLQDRSLQYRAVFTGNGTRSLKVRAGTGCCAGEAGQHFNTLAFGDFPAGGSIGLAPATVDQFAAFTFDQTTAGDQTITFPAPTDPTATYVRWVSNIGTQSFVLYGLIILPGAGTKLVWNGSAWFNGCTGTASSVETVVAAAGVDILNSDGIATGLGNSEAAVPGSQLQLLAGNQGASLIVDGTGAIDVDTKSGAIRVGVAFGSAKTITIGNVVGATGVGVRTGSAGFGVTTGSAGPIAMATDTTGSVTIDSGTTGALNWGTGPNAKVLTFGNGTLTTSIALNVGTVGISVGANATDHPTTIGSTVGVSATSLRAGSGALSITRNGATYAWPSALPSIANQSLTADLAGNISLRGATNVAAGNASGQSIADGAAPAIVTTWTETTDTANAFNAGTGVFTVPTTGFYWIDAQLEYAASVSILNGEFSVQVFVGGVVQAIGANQSQVAIGASKHMCRTTIGIALTAGQTVDIRAAQNGGAGAVLLTASATRNLASISLIS